MRADLVLYIHPSGHLNDLVVPAGAVSCMNAIPGPKLGRYAFEVTDDEIRSAGVVALDVHWALALSGLEPLVAHVRRVSPTVPIVVGGVTAGHYPRELLERHGVDFVIQGDSEPAFVELVRRLRAGEPVADIANLHVRGAPPPRRERISPGDFDATDCLSADWFPTYERASSWDAAAFPQGRTIPVSRGCAFRCPECYGSYATTYGRGYRLRSPERLADLVERAARLGLRNLRLFVAKPPDRTLTELLRELADRGPFRFGSTVGLYLCTAPSLEDVDLLERAFSTPVALSMIPPDEHVPKLKPRRLELERARWRAAAGRIAASPTLTLDAWTTTTESLAHVRDSLGAPPDAPRIKVSYAAVWAVTRPVDGRAVPFDRVHDAAAPVWTFYAARILSPALAVLLGPYRFLDELDALAESTEVVPADEPLSGFVNTIRRSFQRDHLPLLPDLAFELVPLTEALRAPDEGSAGVTLHGALARVRSSGADLEATAHARAPLALERDHRGVTLRAELEIAPAVVALGFVPLERAASRPTPPELEAIARAGLVAITLPRATGDGLRRLRIEVVLRVQEVHLAVLDEGGELIARGRGELGYFRRPDEPPPRDRRRLPLLAPR